jgi:hypothetical protein
MSQSPIPIQNGIFRALYIQCRPKGGTWKRIIGDERISDILEMEEMYEVRVLNPTFSMKLTKNTGPEPGFIPIMVPDEILPLHD